MQDDGLRRAYARSVDAGAIEAGSVPELEDAARTARLQKQTVADMFGSKTQPESPDVVNHPPHYTEHPSGIECIEITRHMPFNTGNVIKYLWRGGQKDGESYLEALKKAQWYLNDEVERIERLIHDGRMPEE